MAICGVFLVQRYMFLAKKCRQFNELDHESILLDKRNNCNHESESIFLYMNHIFVCRFTRVKIKSAVYTR